MTRTRFAKLLAATLIALVAVATTSCGTTSNSSASDDQPAIAATVHIKDGEFDPRETDIEVGGSVMWINDDVASHDLKFLNPNKLYSGVMKPAASWVHTFASAGTYDYYCDFHNTMKGSVVVRPAP
jgi:plastocyanin